MDRRKFIKPSVKRCLFGRSADPDDFLQRQKRLETEETRRFKRKWNFELDNLSDRPVENEYQWSKAGTDIPEFYTKGYPHKCRRRAVLPCVGKSLSFADSDYEDKCEDVTASSPVQCNCDASTRPMDVYIGILPHQPPQEPVTPPKSDFGDSHSPRSEDTNSVNDASEIVSQISSQLLRKRLTQRRLTDMWRILKRRQRSMESGQLHKRARIGRL